MHNFLSRSNEGLQKNKTAFCRVPPINLSGTDRGDRRSQAWLCPALSAPEVVAVETARKKIGLLDCCRFKNRLTDVLSSHDH
ncbi:hypothetical protein ANTRET_LOCUS1934 [Anthophora retusa]